MAIRKGFKPNVQASIKSTQGKQRYASIISGSTARFRFLPLANSDGSIFTRVSTHFKQTTVDGKETTLACLELHGTDETGESCYLCKLAKLLEKQGDKAEKAIGDDIGGGMSFYAQVLQAEKVEGEWEYHGPLLLRLPKGPASAINQIMANQEEAGDDYFFDIEAGQDIFISKTGKGKGTRYVVDRSGKKMNLDKIYPEWEEKFMDNIYDEVNLNIVSGDEQKQSMVRAYGEELDWEALAEDHNL